MTETLTRIALKKKLEIIIKPGKLDVVKKAMTAAGYTGITISQVEGHGNQKGLSKDDGALRMEMLPKLRMEVVVSEKDVEPLIEAIIKSAGTGQPGDGKIFISDIRDVVRIRTGERGEQAL